MTHIPLPDYWKPRPAPALSPEAQALCDETLDAMIAHGAGEPFDYTSPIPKWQFLCHITEKRGIALHGSNNHNLTELVPRKSSDLNEFGAQEAVYAAGDGIWPMYFAIVDRSRVPTIINACIWIELPDGQQAGPLYFFSISRKAFPSKPYLNGMVYLLPSDSFKQQPAITFQSLKVRVPQLASATAVRPLAKLEITPEDFPFLAQMHSHDDDRLSEYAEAMNNGQPWPAA